MIIQFVIYFLNLKKNKKNKSCFYQNNKKRQMVIS